LHWIYSSFLDDERSADNDDGDDDEEASGKWSTGILATIWRPKLNMKVKIFYTYFFIFGGLYT
jgi:hypothetical protein